MKKSTIKTALTFVLLVVVCSMLGCIFGPDKDRRPSPEPYPEFKDLTEREHVIYNLVLSYQMLDIEHYAELLHEDYIGCGQKVGLEIGDDTCLTREQDIQATRGIFDSIKYGHPDENKKIERMQLYIGDGSWSAIDSIKDEPCSDCWYTRRVYDLTLEMASGTTIHGHDHIDFYIVCVEVGGKKKYQIIRRDDVEIPTGGIQ